MKKQILLVLSLCICFVWGMAKQINQSQAEMLAAKYVKQVDEPKQKARSLAFMPSTESESEYYVFNVGKGDGFVIISGDDAMTELVGYSDSGYFDENAIPDNMKSWLDGYAEYVRYVQQSGGRGNKKIMKAAGTPIVDSFVATRWNQSMPYNAQCPTYDSNGNRCPAGCVATAMAQVMKYHEWPDVGEGSNTYTSGFGELTSDFSSHRYDWGNMLADYTGYYDSNGNYVKEWSQQQEDAVARLIYDCGVAVNMDYNSSESGATTASMVNAFNNNFKYDAERIVRVNKSTDEFFSIIKNELDNRMPVLYRGAGIGSAHAFVIDGYDSNNFLHVNWGWGGMSDGFFDMNYMNPSQVGIGGGSGGYAWDQAITILSPNKTGMKPDPEQMTLSYYPSYEKGGVVYKGGITTEKNQIGRREKLTAYLTNVYNSGSAEFNGDIAVGLFDKEGQMISTSTVRGISGLPVGSLYALAFEFELPSFASVAKGRYYLYGISRVSAGYSLWIKFDSASRVVLDVYDNVVVVVEENRELWATKAITVPKHIPLDGGSKFAVYLQNPTSTVLDGYLVYSVKEASTGNVVENGAMPCIVYDGSDYEEYITLDIASNRNKYQIGGEYELIVEGLDLGDEIVPVVDASTLMDYSCRFIIDGFAEQRTLQFINLRDGKMGTSINVDRFDKSEPQDFYVTYLVNYSDADWDGLLTVGLFDGDDNLIKMSENKVSFSLHANTYYPKTCLSGLTPKMDGVADGFYKLRLLSSESSSDDRYYDEWIRVQKDDGVDITIVGNMAYNGIYGGAVENALASDCLKIYPNPATDYAVVDYDGGIRSIEVYAMDGALVARAEAANRIDLSGLQPGVYVVSVATDCGVVRKQLIKR